MGLGGGAEGRTLKSIDPVYIYVLFVIIKSQCFIFRFQMTLPYIICNRNIKNYIQKGLFNEIKNL